MGTPKNYVTQAWDLIKIVGHKNEEVNAFGGARFIKALVVAPGIGLTMFSRL